MYECMGVRVCEFILLPVPWPKSFLILFTRLPFVHLPTRTVLLFPSKTDVKYLCVTFVIITAIVLIYLLG